MPEVIVLVVLALGGLLLAANPRVRDHLGAWLRGTPSEPGHPPRPGSQAPSPGAPGVGPSASGSRVEVVPEGALVSAAVPVHPHTPGHPLPRQRTRYRTEIGDREFAFTFTRVRRVYRAYIREQPGYGRLPTGATATHRLTDGSGSYICISPEPTDVDELLTVTRWWAECTALWLAQGGAFPEAQVARRAITEER